MARMIPATVDEYLQLLQTLSLHGPAWTRAATARATKFLKALADEATRIHNDGLLRVLDEIDWSTTSELLDDWERIAGLPDDCAPAPTTDDQRRAILHARMTASGGQTPAYYIEVAETLLGVEGTITVDEFGVFRVGEDHTGDPLYGEDWAYAWRLFVHNWPMGEPFEVGDEGMGDPVGPNGDFRNYYLECLIDRIEPSHTIGIVGYTSDPP